jgi:4-amino-4-deoxy-L-arabinose transferase-like glycosyltransferase
VSWPALALVVVAFVALAGAYSVAIPAYETNDEPWHYAYVRVLALGRGLPVQHPGDARYVPGEGHQPPLYYLLAAPLLKLSGLAPFEVVAVENPDLRRRPNRYLHPVPGEHFPYADAVRGLHLVRLLSVALGALAVVFIYLAAREALPAYPHAALPVAALAATIPQVLFVHAGVTNDALATLVGSGLFWSLLRLLRSGPQIQHAISAGVWFGLGLLTKQSFLALVPAVLLALLWAPGSLCRRLRALLVVAGLAALIAGWWYVRNALLYGDPLATALQREMGGAGMYPRSLADPYFVTDFPLVTFFSFFAVFGWLSLYVWLPVYLFYALVVAYAAAGLVYLWLRPLPALPIDPPARRALALSAGFIALLYAGLLYYNLTFMQPQGRLLFPALGAAALLIVAGWQRLLAPWPAGQRRVLLALPLANVAIAFAVLIWKVLPAYATTHG